MLSRSVALLWVCVAISMVSARSTAADFIRGDANADGVVTIADSHWISRFLFFTGQGGYLCGDAADFDNDGVFNMTDVIKNVRYQLLLGAPPASPFPEAGLDTPGADPQIDEEWPCTGQEGAQPLEDPAASLRVLDVVVAGGESREAIILLAVSSSVRLAGYFAELDAVGIIPSTQQVTQEPVRHVVYDLTGTLAAGFAVAVSDPVTDRLRIGFLSSFVGEIWIPAGQNEPILEVHVCLEPGTPAGVYPLQLTAGELVDFESGRRIDPELVGGTLTITDAVPTGDCVIEAAREDSKSKLDIVFELGTATGAPGAEVDVPFLVQATDQAVTDGLNFSIDFDETALELVSVDAAFKQPNGEPWSYAIYQFVNTNDHPGNDADEGYTAGWYHLDDIGEGRPSFPSNEVFAALNLRFHVKADAPLGSAEVAFRDGGNYCFHVQNNVQDETICYPWTNRLIAGQVELSTELVSSFVLINGLINIVADVTVFRRGDANGDRQVDISDAQTTLGFLFLGSQRPSCLDAADANDDGLLDISDPIDTLHFLFTGGTSLPPPADGPGVDPTPDGITCATIE